MRKIILLLILFTFYVVSLANAQQRAHIATINGEVVKKNYQVELYPNPSIDYLNVKSDGDSFTNIEFEIYSLIGNKVQLNFRKIDETHYRIPVSQYASGQYVLVIKDKSTRYRRAFKFQKL